MSTSFAETDERMAILEARCALLERAVACLILTHVEMRSGSVPVDVSRAVRGERCRLVFEDVRGTTVLSVRLVGP